MIAYNIRYFLFKMRNQRANLMCFGHNDQLNKNNNDDYWIFFHLNVKSNYSKMSGKNE